MLKVLAGLSSETAGLASTLQSDSPEGTSLTCAIKDARAKLASVAAGQPVDGLFDAKRVTGFRITASKHVTALELLLNSAMAMVGKFLESMKDVDGLQGAMEQFEETKKAVVAAVRAALSP